MWYLILTALVVVNIALFVANLILPGSGTGGSLPATEPGIQPLDCALQALAKKPTYRRQKEVAQCRHRSEKQDENKQPKGQLNGLRHERHTCRQRSAGQY